MNDTVALPRFEWDPVDIVEFYAKAEAKAGTALQRPELEIVLCSATAIKELPRVLDRLDSDGAAPVLIVQDMTPMQRAGEDFKVLVATELRKVGRDVSVLTLNPSEGEGKLVTSRETIDRVRSEIRPGKLIIALGSGCITDIVKHACFELDGQNGGKVPLIAVQTANSVCAFTSRMSVMMINGVKRTVPSRMANALVMDTRVLEDAPPLYRTGGLGDIAVAAVTFADLKLAEQLGMGRWNQLAYDVSSDIRTVLLSGHESVGDGGRVGQEVAGKLLTMAGLALTLSGDSAPLSGYEHVTSHMLDMAAKSNGRAIANHGHQCALATLLSLLLYQHVFERLDTGAIDIESCYPADTAMRERITGVFATIDPAGNAANECVQDYVQKLANWRLSRERFKGFLENWPVRKAALQPLLMEPGRFVDLLRRIGHPLRFDHLETPLRRQEVRWAFHNAHLMRKRFTIGDLAFLGGQFGDAVCDRIFEEFDLLTK